ncbi:MAG: inosine/xanthosine triphosphatase [Patescibacteria group bacterium]|nr:inosine/xanthosine triphosphatase [Patescibacteria group bacterium]
MKINVGSGNKVKVSAVEELIQDYPHLKDAEIISVPVESDVSDQPQTLEETVRGATNRAKKIFDHCDYSIGLESGLMHVPQTKSGRMDVSACAIYDGKEFHLGLSSAWEVPRAVAKYIDDGLDMNEAALKAGLTDSPNLGSQEGLVGVLTKGRLTRKAYTMESIRTALIHLEETHCQGRTLPRKYGISC